MSRGALVMVCDVDLDVADATRTHTVEVARWFARLGAPVELVARGDDPCLPGVAFRDAGRAATTAARFAKVNAAAVTALVRSVPRARYCYVRHEWAQVPVVAVARLLGYRVVTQVDDVQYGPGYEGAISPAADQVRRFATKAMGRLATGVVAVTAGIRDLLVRDYGVPRERVVVLPNGVDLETFRPWPRDEACRVAGLDPTLRYAVFTGLFAEWVAFDTIVGAFARVAASRPDTRLVLVGDGPRRAEVERLVDARGIRDRVVFTGFVRDRGVVRALIGSANVCLVAHAPGRLQRIGASPTKLAEYFAGGRAVVAVDVPGVREAIEGAGAGIVVPADEAAYAAAVGTLLDDAERADAFGVAARRAAEADYSWEAVVRRTLALFGADAPVDRPA